MPELPPANPVQAPGTSEASWRAGLDPARLPALDVSSWASAVVLAAHPDDEVLGAGGVIALLAAAGARLRLVAVTDGEASHPGHPDPAALARRRAAERARALQALGASGAEVIRLGLADAGLAGRADAVESALDGLLAGFDVCLAPWEADVHADHEAVGRAARRLAPEAALWFYPVWMWHWARPDDPRVPWPRAAAARLPAAVARRKQAALGCFTSQQEPRPPDGEPVLSAAFLDHFGRDYELLFAAAGHDAAAAS